RLHLLDRHAGEAFLDAHRDLADRARREARGRPQRQALRARIQDVERADVGAGALGDHLDDALERLLQVLGPRGDRADVLDAGEALGARGLLAHATTHVRGRLAVLSLHAAAATLGGARRARNGGLGGRAAVT